MTVLHGRPTERGAHPPQLIVLGVAVVITCAGLVSLAQDDALAATGRRIAELHTRRSELMEQRADALVALAAATDPRALEARAEALGFASPDSVEYVAVSGLEPAAQLTLDVAASSPLALILREGERPRVERSGPLARLLAIGARPASAAEPH
jgi:hypothetical protein